MVDVDAAIGYVVAHGDLIERARLSYLLTRKPPAPDVVGRIAAGQTAGGGWPASGDGSVPSVDATCFRLAELDDLGALQTPAAERGARWLASVQRPDGAWEESDLLAPEAPAWAMPGDPEARLYLTAVAGFWLTVAEAEAAPADPTAPSRYAPVLRAAAQYVVGQLRPDGSWPSFLAAGWHAVGLLHEQQFFYESARMQYVLGDRVPELSATHAASMAAALRRVATGDDDWLLAAAFKRLTETQRTDGGWDSDEGPAFDVHTTLIAIRACR